MRELTDAEYRTILTILGHPGSTERRRIQLAGLPSSTYNVVRKRSFREGWLTDVVVPNPGPCGLAAVEVGLSRPSVAVKEALTREWAADPGCVLLWSGVHAVLGVFFRWGRSAPPSPPAAVDGAPSVFRVSVGRGSGTLPVFFDYSGLWARFGRRPSPESYPSGLDIRATEAEPRMRAAGLALLDHPSDAPIEVTPWTNLLRLHRARRRAVERGVVLPRTILNVAALPPFDGRRIGETILIEGRLRPGGTSSALLNALTGDCGVFPFLFVESEGSVVLAGHGQTRSAGPGRVLVPSAHRPVLATLTEHLDPVDVLVEPVEAIEERIRHRYHGPPHHRRTAG